MTLFEMPIFNTTVIKDNSKKVKDIVDKLNRSIKPANVTKPSKDELENLIQ